jgi:hypothetical protein
MPEVGWTVGREDVVVVVFVVVGLEVVVDDFVVTMLVVEDKVG